MLARIGICDTYLSPEIAAPEKTILLAGNVGIVNVFTKVTCGFH
jgi:hypothetical protein